MHPFPYRVSPALMPPFLLFFFDVVEQLRRKFFSGILCTPARVRSLHPRPKTVGRCLDTEIASRCSYGRGALRWAAAKIPFLYSTYLPLRRGSFHGTKRAARCFDPEAAAGCSLVGFIFAFINFLPAKFHPPILIPLPCFGPLSLFFFESSTSECGYLPQVAEWKWAAKNREGGREKEQWIVWSMSVFKTLKHFDCLLWVG